ncbi:MAG: molecular chaperone HtpG [Clostridia bacterium]|nr:molecular chaperone HtpG [Clostridia bacterium]
MDEINNKKGGISVDTEHIFPIIKKWLYSEKDIFLREIVSNATDAITKLKRLEALGEASDIGDDFRITVTLDKNARTLAVTDNGIGMTEDELQRYICQIALSGALDFIQKYEGEGDASKNGIIGHFGLGFYSAFMVSAEVEIVTRSYTGAPAVRWLCDEAGEYEIFPSDEEARGTTVTLHIAEGEDEYLDAGKIRSMLNKYCAFMPIEIYFVDVDEETEKAAKPAEEGAEPEAPAPVNDTHPLWQKAPSECTPEEYNDFYHKVFGDFRDPLFYIHINADYPLNFKGILYFPRINHEYDSLEGEVKLYYNQVFVADNIKEVIPEYLLMLKGVLDCPELPLNVSRSYLQTNSYVSKVSAHIVKKVADKLNSLYNTEREKYEQLWDDIRTFIEYACMRDRKFYDRVKSALLLHLTDDTYTTIDDYLADAKEKHENTIYYAADKTTQAQYISLFAAQGIKVALFDRMIDVQFIHTIEQNMSGVKFVRIDADVAEALRGEGEATADPVLEALFREVSGNEKLTVKFENLKDTRLPAMLNISEESRRMEEMMKLYAMSSGTDAGSFPQEMTLVVNAAAPLTARLSGMAADEAKADSARKMAKQIYMLALLAQRQLRADELQSFLDDSFDLLEQL